MTNNINLAQIHYQSMLAFASEAASRANLIREMVNDGAVTWSELSFTDADVSSRLRVAMTRLGQMHYRSMQNDAWPADSYANIIRTFVKEGTTTWDELGFTDADVSSRLRVAMTRLGQRHYRSMQDNHQWALSFAAIIHEMVNSGTTTWDELGFTDADVAARLPVEKVA